MLKSWNSGYAEPVEFNEFHQPIGKNAAKLSTQIGRTVKDGKKFPLTAKEWRHVSIEVKEAVWKNFNENFILEKEYKDHFIQQLGNRWKAWKGTVKRTFYDKYQTDLDRLANCPGLVEEEQWPILVKHWSSPEFKLLSEKNKFNRSKQKVPSRTGKRSFAAVKDVITKEKGQEPTEYDFWVTTHVDLAKTPLDRKAQRIVKKITEVITKDPEGMKCSEQRAKILDKFLGPEKSGQMRSYGFGPTNRQVQALKKQKTIIEEKVSLLTKSIREGLKEELKVEMRDSIEQIVREVLISILKDGGDSSDGTEGENDN